MVAAIHHIPSLHDLIIRRHIRVTAEEVAALEDLEEVQNLAGRELVHLFIIHPLKFKLSHLFAERLKTLQQFLFFGMFFSAMPGTTDRALLKNYMIYLSQRVFPFGLVRKM
jgi:hypothetical protein